MVPELLALNAPPVLIVALLLVVWNKKLPRVQDSRIYAYATTQQSCVIYI